MSHILPRFNRALLAIEDARKIGRIIQETGALPSTTVQRATLAGDPRRLRGIPAIARGVSGTSPGTDPLTVVRRMR